MKISSAVRDGACWGFSLFYFYVVSQSSLVSGYWMATCCWFFLLWRRSGCFGALGSGYVLCGRPVIVVCAVGEVRCSRASGCGVRVPNSCWVSADVLF